MSFDIPIKIDPGDALAKIKGVEGALATTEKRGKEVAQSMTGAGRAFASLGEAVKREQDALKRTSEIHRQLVAQNQPLAQGFAKVAEAMKREQEMLDKIQGPARRYQEDLQSLDQLLSKNAISTQQYAEQVTKLNQSLEETPAPKQSTVGSSMMGMAGAGVLPGALLAAGHQVEDLVHESEDLEDRYTELKNKALKFGDATHSTNTVLDEQVRLGSEIHTGAAKTIELYDGVRDATDGMNFAHSEQIRMAKTLAEGSLLGGKAADAAAQSFLNLRVAFETGQDPARTLRGVMKEFPDISDHLSESLGMSKDQIIDFASKGKLGYEQITLALTQHTEKLDETASQLKKTNAEQRAEMQQTADIAMNRGVPALLAMSDSGRKWADMQTFVADGYRRDARPVFEDIAAKLEEQKIKWLRAQEAADSWGQRVQAAATAASGAVRGVGTAIDKMATAFAQDGFYALAKAEDPWFVKPETPEKIKKAAHELDILADIRRRLAVEKAARENSQDFLDTKAFDKLGKSGLAEQAENEKEYLKRITAIEEAETDVSKRAAELIAENGEKVQKAQEETAAKAEEAAARMKEAWASGAGSIAGDLISAFQKGDQSINDMVEHAMMQLALLELKMAAAQMGGPAGRFIAAAIGGIGGFATGGSFTVPGGPGPAMPRAWGGNDWTVGGAGGTDSKHVHFMATPGERVLVQTPEQQRAAGSGPSVQRMQTIVQLQNDRRELAAAIGTREGVREVVNIDRQLRKARRR
jgi:tape measure domain-containing protein